MKKQKLNQKLTKIVSHPHWGREDDMTCECKACIIQRILLGETASPRPVESVKRPERATRLDYSKLVEKRSKY